MGKNYNILFVCTGNMCRSPVAEGLFNKLVAKAGLDNVHSTSAGTQAVVGGKAADESVAVAKEVGVDISGHVCRQITEEMADEADLIIAMDESHRFAVMGMNSKYAEKTKLITSYNPNIESEVGISDPIGGPPFLYRECIGKIFESLQWLIKDLKTQPDIMEATQAGNGEP